MVGYELNEKEKNNLGLTSKPVGKMKRIMVKLENALLKERQLQKEKKESKTDKR